MRQGRKPLFEWLLEQDLSDSHDLLAFWHRGFSQYDIRSGEHAHQIMWPDYVAALMIPLIQGRLVETHSRELSLARLEGADSIGGGRSGMGSQCRPHARIEETGACQQACRAEEIAQTIMFLASNRRVTSLAGPRRRWRLHRAVIVSTCEYPFTFLPGHVDGVRARRPLWDARGFKCKVYKTT